MEEGALLFPSCLFVLLEVLFCHWNVLIFFFLINEGGLGTGVCGDFFVCLLFPFHMLLIFNLINMEEGGSVGLAVAPPPWHPRWEVGSWQRWAPQCPSLSRAGWQSPPWGTGPRTPSATGKLAPFDFWWPPLRNQDRSAGY